MTECLRQVHPPAFNSRSYPGYLGYLANAGAAGKSEAGEGNHPRDYRGQVARFTTAARAAANKIGDQCVARSRATTACEKFRAIELAAG